MVDITSRAFFRNATIVGAATASGSAVYGIENTIPTKILKYIKQYSKIKYIQVE
jgi:hypothetical protein